MSKKRCLTVGQRSRDLRSLSRDRLATFFGNFSSCLKRRNNVNSRPTVAWLPNTVAWPFSDFFWKFSELFETSKKRCLTVGRRPRDLRPLSRDRSATFFKIFLIRSKRRKKRCLTVVRRSRDLRPLSRDRSGTFFKISPNCGKRRKNVLWQSADGCVTSDHCRVTVQRLFKQNFWIARNVGKNVVLQSANGRVTSDHCHVTVQRLFSKFFRIAWNVEKTFFDNRPTVAWPPTTIAWPFSDFLQKISELF